MTFIDRRRRAVCTLGSTLVAAPFVCMRPANAAEFTFKYANDVSTTHPLTVWITKAFDEVREKTSGRVDVKVFPNNQLGSDNDLLSQLRLGGIDFFTMSGLLIASMVPIAAINGIAFAFKNYDDVWKAMDGDLGAHVRASIEKSGIVVFDKIFNGGYRQITSSTRPIHSPADLKGFKIRVPVSPLWVSMFKALGAAPASINFSEVYSALQTKIVDGQETPLVTIDSSKLYEVQKYCALTNHMWDGFWFLANRSSFARLPEDLRRTVRDAINSAALQQRAEVISQNAALQSALTKKGLVFNQPDTGAFRDALRTAGFYAEWQKNFGAEAWALLEKSVGKLV